MLYAYFFLGKAKPWNPECRLIALLQMKQRDERLEAKRFAYSIILTGSETTKALELFALNDIQFINQLKQINKIMRYCYIGRILI